jgi:hypothetical protein
MKAAAARTVLLWRWERATEWPLMIAAIVRPGRLRRPDPGSRPIESAAGPVPMA